MLPGGPSFLQDNEERGASWEARVMSVDITSKLEKKIIHLPFESTELPYAGYRALFETTAKERGEEKEEKGNEDDYLQYLNLNADDSLIPSIPDQEIAVRPEPDIIVQPEPNIIVQPEPEPDIIVQLEPDLGLPKDRADVSWAQFDHDMSRLEDWIKATLEAGKKEMLPMGNQELGIDNNRRRRGRVLGAPLVGELKLSFEITDDIREFTIHVKKEITGGENSRRRPELKFEERIRGWVIRTKKREDSNRYDWKFIHERVRQPFRSTREVINFILHNTYPKKRPVVPRRGSIPPPPPPPPPMEDHANSNSSNNNNMIDQDNSDVATESD